MSEPFVPSLQDVFDVLQSNGCLPVLLPIKARDKAPILKEWSKLSYEDTTTDEYQADLRRYPNTGVVLGRPDPCTIDCDTAAFLEAFLALNPALASTLITKGASGGQIWLYISGPRPDKVYRLFVPKDSPLAIGAKKGPDKKGMVQVGEFRAQGGQSVIRGIHQDTGEPYTWNGKIVPVVFQFKAIKWPFDIVLPWLEKPAAAKSVPPSPPPVAPPPVKPSDAVDDDIDRQIEDLLPRAQALLTIPFLWAQFGFSEPADWTKCHSPFRDDKKPSFSVTEKEPGLWLFNDFGNGDAGDQYDFFCRKNGVDRKQGHRPFLELAGLLPEFERLLELRKKKLIEANRPPSDYVYPDEPAPRKQKPPPTPKSGPPDDRYDWEPKKEHAESFKKAAQAEREKAQQESRERWEKSREELEKEREERLLQELIERYTAALLTSEELESEKIEPRAKMLGEWLREGDLGFIFGERGIGKTWLVYAIASCVSTNNHLNTWDAHGTFPVLYIDGEMPMDLTRDRLQGLAKGNKNLTVLHHEKLFNVAGDSINIVDPRTQKAITSICVSKKTKLLILDNLSCLASGMRENEADDWEKLLNWLLDLRRRRIAVIIIHHSGVSGRMRGTTKREDSAAWVIKVENTKSETRENETRFETSFTKRPRSSTTIEWNRDWVFKTEENGEVSIGCEEVSNEGKVLQLIQAGLETPTDIAEEMGCVKSMVSKMAHRLEAKKLIEIKNRRYFPRGVMVQK